MKTYIGIDLGTSSLKALLVDSNGSVLKSVRKEYPVMNPYPKWSEQNPLDWLNAIKEGVKELLVDQDKTTVNGIGFGGQMHGLVTLDKNDNVIRPCILWNDGRSGEQSEYLNNVIGRKTLSKYTANISYAGFTASKILWMKEEEPDNFIKINKIMLPKDYLVYMLTGKHVSEYSDAAGMLLVDVKNKCWSKEMCDICSVKEEWLPKLYESYENVGGIKDEFASYWGISKDIAVAIGAGDNAAAAVGVGVINNGDCNISLGTSGTVFISQDNFYVDDNNSLHSFNHASGKYHLMGCILTAASANSWWMDIIESKDYEKEQEGLEQYLGKNNLYFLPYLTGERSPHNDVDAKGALIGVTSTTTRKQITLAVLEGVAFALRDCIEIARSNGLIITNSKICGGGAKSALWRKIIANICNLSIEIPKVEEGASYGASILAMVAAKEYESIQEATKYLVGTIDKVEPTKELVDLYEQKFKVFKKLYPTLKDTFKEM